MKLSAERDGDKLYDSTDNPFTVFADGLARMPDEEHDR